MTLNYPCIIVSHERLPNGFTRVALWWDEQESIQLNLFGDFEQSLHQARYIAECGDSDFTTCRSYTVLTH